MFLLSAVVPPLQLSLSAASGGRLGRLGLINSLDASAEHLAGEQLCDVAFLAHVEDVHRKVVLHAKADRRRVHHPQTLLQHLDEGQTIVVRAGPVFEVLVVNQLVGLTLSSPAISDGQIFLRTAEWLYCVGERQR